MLTAIKMKQSQAGGIDCNDFVSLCCFFDDFRFFHETSKIDPKKRDLRRNSFFSMSTLTTSNAMKC